MRTARALTVSASILYVGGCAWSGGGWGRGSMAPGGCMVWGDRVVVVSQHALRHTPPPVNRMTNRCKNITLPQTSFADGNSFIIVQS